MTNGSGIMPFNSDPQRRPKTAHFNGTAYLYAHILQGDVVGILDKTDALAVECKHDAWIKPTVCFILKTEYEQMAELSSFRY